MRNSVIKSKLENNWRRHPKMTCDSYGRVCTCTCIPTIANTFTSFYIIHIHTSQWEKEQGREEGGKERRKQRGRERRKVRNRGLYTYILVNLSDVKGGKSNLSWNFIEHTSVSWAPHLQIFHHLFPTYSGLNRHCSINLDCSNTENNVLSHFQI